MPAAVSAPAGTVPAPPAEYDEEMPTIIKPSASSQLPIAEAGVPEAVDMDAESPHLRERVPEPVIERVREPEPPRREPEPPRREPAVARPSMREAPPTPPHPSQSVGADSGPMPASSSGLGSSAELEALRPSKLGTALLVILVLLSLGLVIASVVLKQTPDPRPLLEDLWRRQQGR
jgi:hypothetical protein